MHIKSLPQHSYWILQAFLLKSVEKIFNRIKDACLKVYMKCTRNPLKYSTKKYNQPGKFSILE